jgi:biotin carboxylase
MKNLLFIAPTARERREIPPLARELGLQMVWDDFAGSYFDDFRENSGSLDDRDALDIVSLIESLIEKYRTQQLTGVTSAVGYPGMSAVSVISNRLGLPGPSAEAVMTCEHKYLSRMAQKKFVPDAVPDFILLDHHDTNALGRIERYPVFVKPVKSCMSMNAFEIRTREELAQRCKQAVMPERFNKPFDDMLRAYTEFDISCSYLIVEGLLEGHQVSLEGYVAESEPVVLGILDALMFPATRSFRRFQYPSQLPQRILTRMEDVAKRFFKGIGYKNAMFNMELIWNPQTDSVSIIEVNPKIASQFPDLFEKVDGAGTYKTLLEIAAGQQPSFAWGNGRFQVAGSCVLRRFDDGFTLRTPSAQEIADVCNLYPDALIRITAVEGTNLSEQLQDVASFRYGLINIGADSTSALEDKFEAIKQMLPFEFGQPVGARV